MTIGNYNSNIIGPYTEKAITKLGLSDNFTATNISTILTTIK